MRDVVWLILLLLLSVSFMACSSPTTNILNPKTTSKQTTVTPATPLSSSVTYSQLADSGKIVFSSKCASCHGPTGQGAIGPAIIGPGSSLVKYGTAKGLLNKISLTMPASSPGSLSSQDYLNVFGYLLVQNNVVSSSTAYDQNQLTTITLK